MSVTPFGRVAQYVRLIRSYSMYQLKSRFSAAHRVGPQSAAQRDSEREREIRVSPLNANRIRSDKSRGLIESVRAL